MDEVSLLFASNIVEKLEIVENNMHKSFSFIID